MACPPSWWQATSNDTRVRSEGFSKAIASVTDGQEVSSAQVLAGIDGECGGKRQGPMRNPLGKGGRRTWFVAFGGGGPRGNPRGERESARVLHEGRGISSIFRGLHIQLQTVYPPIGVAAAFRTR